MSLFKKDFNYPLINFTVFLFLLFISISNIEYIVKFFLNILSILFPFLLGFIVSYAINPFVLLLEKRMSRKLSVILVIILFLFVLLFLFISILPMLYHQVAGFSIQLIQIFHDLENKFSFSLELQKLFTKISSFVIQSVGKVTFATTIDIFLSLIRFFSQFFLSVISCIYFLFYMEDIRGVLKRILKFKCFRFYSFLQQVDINMVCYVKSLGLFMFIQFIEYSLLFLIIGHPYWLVLGILIGLFTILPYIGGLLSNLIAITSAFMISKELFYLTLIVAFIFPIIDEYIISPKIYGERNNIHPVVTVFLLSLGGMIGGILGVVMAIPLYLLVRTTILFFRDDLKKGVHSLKDVL